jgi:primosomal protein N' (replication factor Y)
MAADLSLNIPDFRAGERTYQLLTQVAGRAGRGSSPGRVIIQTYNPNHYSIQLAQQQDFLAFYQQEAQYRQEMGYPPFSRLIYLRIEGNSSARTLQLAKALERLIARVLPREKRFQEQIEVLGPSMAPLARLKGKNRYQILLKGKKWSVLHDFTAQVLAQAEKEISFAGVKMAVDVDPVNML